MKAAIVTSAGSKPTFGEFDNPVPREGFEVITVTAAALTNLTRGRAAGSHYSADNHYPFVPGVDGVGILGKQISPNSTVCGFIRLKRHETNSLVRRGDLALG